MPKRRSLNPLLNRKTTQLRAEEMHALISPLLELLPQAALLVDLEEEKILFSNTAALRLTAFSRQEFADLDLDKLFPADLQPEGHHFLDWEPQALSRPFPCAIILRSGTALPVEVTPVLMDSSAQSAPATGAAAATIPNPGLRDARFLVLHIEPVSEIDRRRQATARREQHREILAKINAGFARLFHSTDEQARRDALQILMPDLARLSGMDALALYWCEEREDTDSAAEPMAQCAARWAPETAEVPAFPPSLPKTEITAIHLPVHWSKGKRILIPLQQQLRKAGFGFSYLVPLISTDTPDLCGLLAGAAGTAPEEESLTSMQMVANLLVQSMVFTSAALVMQRSLAQSARSSSMMAYAGDLLFDGTLQMDSDLRIINANQSALTMFEYKLPEIIGQEVGQVLIADQSLIAKTGAPIEPGMESTTEQLIFLNQLRGALHQTTPMKAQQIKLYRRSGASFLANYRVVPVSHIDPQAGLLIILQDLSELDFIRKENEQLNQRAYLGEITSSFAHEIRNPINSLSSGIQLLLSSVSDEFPDRGVIEDLEVDLERLTRIVDSGLSFFRKKKYEMNSVRLDQLVRRLAGSSWQHRLYKNHIKLEILAPDNLPSIQGDESALEHVFTNLVNNAVDAMSELPGDQPRDIILKFSTVSNDQKQEMLDIRISDTGPGIQDVVMERIFDPFFTTKAKGTGVGLAIVRRIVSAHGGAISIINNVGGTTFQLRLPVLNHVVDPEPHLPA